MFRLFSRKFSRDTREIVVQKPIHHAFTIDGLVPEYEYDKFTFVAALENFLQHESSIAIGAGRQVRATIPKICHLLGQDTIPYETEVWSFIHWPSKENVIEIVVEYFSAEGRKCYSKSCCLQKA
jgi:hypothetical protein